MVMLKVSNLIKLNRTVTVIVTVVTLVTMLQNYGRIVIVINYCYDLNIIVCMAI